MPDPPAIRLRQIPGSGLPPHQFAKLMLSLRRPSIRAGGVGASVDVIRACHLPWQSLSALRKIQADHACSFAADYAHRSIGDAE
jgi:hypothetical protein